MGDEISADDVYAVPWLQEALEHAQALTGTGIDASTALIAAIALPAFLRVAQLVSPYIETHNKDLRDTIDVAKAEQLATLYEAKGSAAFLAAIDAAERQSRAEAALRAAGSKSKSK